MKQNNEEETSSMVEVGKAVQEVSKTTDHALHVADKFGGFMSRIIGGSLEQAVGISARHHRKEVEHKLSPLSVKSSTKRRRFFRQPAFDSGYARLE